MIILFIAYIIGSYLLFWYASSHDAEIKKTSVWEEITPAHVLAPIFAPILMICMLIVILRK